MSVTFWTIIFVLLNCPPNGLCLNFNVASEVKLVCRVVPFIGGIVGRKITYLQCWRKPFLGRTRGIQCVATKLNTSRIYVQFICRNCDTASNKFSLSKHHCILPNEEALLRNSASKRNGNLTNYIVHFINRTKRVDNVILCLQKFNRFKWRTTDTKYWNVFISSKRDASITSSKKNVSWKRTDKIYDKVLARKRRHILGNYTNSTTFLTYSRPINITSHSVTPSRTVQSPSVTSRSVSDLSDFCPQSVIVDCSTISVTPTVVGTRHAESLVGTSQLTALTQFTTIAMLRNSTYVAEAGYSSSASKLALNASLTLISAQSENSTQNATPFAYNINNGSITVTCTTQGFAFTTSFRCPIITPTDLESLSTTNLPSTTVTTTSRQDTKFKPLYIGLIAGGAVILSIIICIAMVLLIRRYRRIQALRRTAKQISYFNRFDCSSPWDEPDRFGGSKLSVFTLKNSKFDIDWDSTHDTTS